MSDIKINKKTAEVNETECHILPIKLSEDIPDVNADQFRVKHDDNGISTVYFRGRKLTSKPLPLDKKYIGVTGCIKATEMKNYYDYEDEEEEEDTGPLPEESRELDISHKFDSIHVWGHESLPNETNDPWYSGIQNLINLSHLIHDPVD